jgi:deoxyribodipyrimidine photo-lyase
LLPLHLVWIKRDARVHDHRALHAALEAGGPVAALHVFEPSYWAAPEHDAMHFHFLVDGLLELRQRLQGLGIPLLLRVGEVPTVLGDLHARHPLGGLWSHAETGCGLTFARDLRVAAWARAAGVPWRELWQTGVVRRLRTRDGWAGRWKERMRGPVLPAPTHARGASGLDPGEVPAPDSLGLARERRPLAMRGGEGRAHALLHSFLHGRGEHYRSAMSSPLAGWHACSRLSPYLAWGQISVRACWQAARARLSALEEAGRMGEPVGMWLQSVHSFEKRLAWHCHFMQKLEDEPAIEFRNINRAFDGLREDAWNDAHFAAWCAGQTGYPMVDACMRALQQAGWINFRMRAMLASFAAYHLWLHWRRPGVFLAAHFLDFEPGIHWSQFQMQSGVTGINTVRIYSPVKQVQDQDPEGTFIRRFVPELAGVPTAWLAEPHRIPPLVQADVGCVIGRDYPAPIVDHREAMARARTLIHAHRARPEVQAEGARVWKKHGSRQRPRDRR